MEENINQIKYKYNPVHRNNTTGKTQWSSSVSIKKEEELFRFGYRKNWRSSGNVFSIWIINGNVLFLDNKNKLRFARFTGLNEWHGWPADGKRSPKDIPSYEILRQWVDAKYTSRAKILKLRGRKICSI